MIQLLFFHPSYIQKIVESDQFAINEIPIKLVITENEKDEISVSYPNPKERFQDYNLDPQIGEELLEKTELILAF